MRRKLTRRALTVSVVGAVLVVAGVTAQAGWLYVLAAGVFGIVACSFLYRHRLGALEVRRLVPLRARAGDEARIALSVTNRSRRSVPAFRVEDGFAPFGSIAVACERLGPDARGEIELTRRPMRRGVFDAGSAKLSSGAPFGFVRSTRVTSVSSPIVVVPRWVELRSFPILEPSSYPADVLHERARVGAGEEFLGVREYRPGDSPRAVHWRTTARVGRLMVREYEEQPSARVGIVLAGADHGTAPASSFEALVSAAASIALYAIATGHPVELVRAEPDGPPVSLDDPEREDALDWLASARAADVSPVEPCAHALGRLGRRGTLVVCASTSGAAGAGLGDAVRRAMSVGARVLVVAALSSSWSEGGTEVDPASLGGGRAHVRVVAKGKDLRSCLEG